MNSQLEAQTMVKQFETFSLLYSSATKEGNYRLGNKNFDQAVNIAKRLKEENTIGLLSPYLNHSDLGVRTLAASILLTFNQISSEQCLEVVAASDDFFSFIAETTLAEWRKGNLQLV